MTARELINNFRKTPNEQTLASLSQLFKFERIEVDGRQVGKNLEFRSNIVHELLPNFSLTDILLIRSLFNEEVACDRETQNHDNLYQLCYYLYSLGQLEDTFLLYDAKFNATNFDTALMLDRQSITVGHKVTGVIMYVKGQLKNDASLEERYSGLLTRLNELEKEPDYESAEVYKEFLDGYFGVKDDVTIAKENIIKKRQKRQQRQPDPIADLNIFLKAFSFFVLIPKRGLLGIIQIESGCILKEQQRNYYLVAGVSFCIMSALITTNYNLPFLLLWCSGFGISYLFDVFYNRQRQVDHITRNLPPNSMGIY